MISFVLFRQASQPSMTVILYQDWSILTAKLTADIVGTTIHFLSTINSSRTEGSTKKLMSPIDERSPIIILENNTFKEHKESCLYILR